MKFRTVLFDLDGTLVDSKRDIARAELWMLHQFGIDHLTEEEIYPRIGRPLTVQLLELFPPALHHRIPEAIDLYLSYYRPRALDTTRPFPGTEETLRRLHESGCRLAVATTKSTKTAQRVVSHFGLDRWLSAVQGTDGTPPKPDPFVIQSLLTATGSDGGTTLMVGDTDADIGAGRAAGVATCGVTFGSLRADEIRSLGPDYIIDAIEELVPIVLPGTQAP